MINQADRGRLDFAGKSLNEVIKKLKEAGFQVDVQLEVCAQKGPILVVDIHQKLEYELGNAGVASESPLYRVESKPAETSPMEMLRERLDSDKNRKSGVE